MRLESSLGLDFDAKLGANVHSGPALAVDDETLECLFDRAVSSCPKSQSHHHYLLFIMRRETVGEKSLQDAQFLS